MPLGQKNDGVFVQLGAAVELDNIKCGGAGTVFPKVVVLDIGGISELALRLKTSTVPR